MPGAAGASPFVVAFLPTNVAWVPKSMFDNRLDVSWRYDVS